MVDGFLVDVTLQQFDTSLPKVQVALEKRCRCHKPHFRGDEALENLKEWGSISPLRHMERVNLILGEFRKLVPA